MTYPAVLLGMVAAAMASGSTHLPTPHTLGVRTHSLDDSGSRPVESWSAPVDWHVYAVAPAGSLEPFEVGRDAITWDLDVLGPDSNPPGPKDRVIWQGVEYAVEGRFASYNFGPFDFKPGGRVRLKRVEG